MIDGCGAAAGLRENEEGGIGYDLEDHVACGVSDDCVGVGVKVIHQHVTFVCCVCCWFGLFRSDLVEGGEDAGVDGAAIE